MIVGLLLCCFNGGMYILFSPAFNLGEAFHFCQKAEGAHSSSAVGSIGDLPFS